MDIRCWVHQSQHEYLDYIILNLHPSVVQEAINDMRAKMKTMASGDFRNLARYTKDLCTIEILVNMSLFLSARPRPFFGSMVNGCI